MLCTGQFFLKLLAYAEFSVILLCPRN
jgi:hypothetical protein